MINYLKQNILSLIIIILLIITIVQINLFTNQYQVEQRKIQNYYSMILIKQLDNKKDIMKTVLENNYKYNTQLNKRLNEVKGDITYRLLKEINKIK